MTNLGMFDVTADPFSSSCASHFLPGSPDRMDEEVPRVDYKSIKLNLVKHLCESPNILYSNLSKNALRLLHSGEMSDIEFEVISCVPFAQSNRSAFLANLKVHIFRAHRAIVCSRCEYFRRALLSGMKEDIDRKIVVQDTSPVIFRRFLLYLYGAPIDKTVSADQICELMLLGDRYSLDELKDICEQILKAQIDEESVICLLSIADRFNANTLKSNCLAFISNRMHLIKQELFVELGAKLKEEVYELIHWRSRTPQPWHSVRQCGGDGVGGDAVNGETKPKNASCSDTGGGGAESVGGVGANNSHNSTSGRRLHAPSVASPSSTAASSSSASVPARSPSRPGSAAAAATTSPFM